MVLRVRPNHIDLASYPSDLPLAYKRVLSSRNITSSDIDKPLSRLLHVDLLKGSSEAAALIAKHIKDNQKICIVGDFDADGATSTAVIMKVLLYLDVKVDYLIPNRQITGYGLTLELAKQDEILSSNLIITVDNGISSIEAVSFLREQGKDVIITDHHLPSKVLPDANVIVNPNQDACSFPSKNLAGVGVAFYVMLALRKYYRENHLSLLDKFSFTSLLDLVAIGTIADVVPLDFNNRLLVDQGLKRMRLGQSCCGVDALLKVSQLNEANLSSTDIAFSIAPKINAAGRIADMGLGVDCLLAKSKHLAMDYAVALCELNHERKSIENKMKAQAIELIKSFNLGQEVAICLYSSDFHEGVSGILASRLRETYQKVSFVFSGKKDIIKGSARSISHINMIDLLSEINTQYPNLIHSYGGHRMAAGLSIKRESFTQFKTVLLDLVFNKEKEAVVDHSIYTDGPLTESELTTDMAEFLKTAEVWGQSIPEPVFNNTFYIKQLRLVGDNHAKMRLVEKESGFILDAIAFNHYDEYKHFINTDLYQIAYQLGVNYWEGRKQLSLIIKYMTKL